MNQPKAGPPKKPYTTLSLRNSEAEAIHEGIQQAAKEEGRTGFSELYLELGRRYLGWDKFKSLTAFGPEGAIGFLGRQLCADTDSADEAITVSVTRKGNIVVNRVPRSSGGTPGYSVYDSIAEAKDAHPDIPEVMRRAELNMPTFFQQVTWRDDL